MRPSAWFDKTTPVPHNKRHEDVGSSASPQGDRDTKGFGEAAKALVGAGACPDGSLAEVQAQRLIEWARHNGLLIAEADFEELPLVCDETGEHEVRFRDNDQRLLKKTWPGTFGMVPEWTQNGWRPASATPLEYLERFTLHNLIFQDDVRLEGAIVSEKPVSLVGAVSCGLSLVISQRWLVAADADAPHPTLDEISTFMAELGFVPLENSMFGWFHEQNGILALDAKPDNFIKTPDGILPFDLVLMHAGEPS